MSAAAPTATGLTADDALRLAGFDWRVIPLHAGGKRPHLRAWQRAATTDESVIAGWWSQWPNANIGVAMGRESNLIDLECDSKAAEDLLCELFGGEFPHTPTFEASRGKHRLFRYTSELPYPDKATFRVGEIDFKIGGGSLGSYCVFPPSVHPSGKRYEWIIPPDEAEPAEIPPEVIGRIVAYIEEGAAGPDARAGKSAGYWDKIAMGVPEGGDDETPGRNNAAAAYIGKMLHETSCDPFDTNRVSLVWSLVRQWNALNQPPLDEQELWQAFQSIVQREQRQCSNDPRRAVGADDVPKIIRRLRKALRLPSLVKVVKRGRVGGEFELHLEDGRIIVLGDARAVLSIARVRTAIYDTTDSLFPMNKQKWPRIAEAIARVAEVIDTPPQSELLRHHIAEFLDYCRHASWSQQDDDGSNEWLFSKLNQAGRSTEDGAFRDKQGVLHLHQPSLTRFMRDELCVTMKLPDLIAALSRLGFHNQKKQRRSNGLVAQKHLWLSPPGFVP